MDVITDIWQTVKPFVELLGVIGVFMLGLKLLNIITGDND